MLLPVGHAVWRRQLKVEGDTAFVAWWSRQPDQMVSKFERTQGCTVKSRERKAVNPEVSLPLLQGSATDAQLKRPLGRDDFRCTWKETVTQGVKSATQAKQSRYQV